MAESLAVRADEIAARDLAAEHEDGTGGPAHVWGSASLLRRVVDNFLDNAVLHNRNGGPDSGCRSLRPSRTPIAGGGWSCCPGPREGYGPSSHCRGRRGRGMRVLVVKDARLGGPQVVTTTPGVGYRIAG